MLKKNEAPETWRGTLNTTYYLGPGMENSTLKVKLEVHTSNKMAYTYNTIGILYGDEEPGYRKDCTLPRHQDSTFNFSDRYVLVGNHRDAWSLGSIDPSSGTASMLEMARAFGAIKQNESNSSDCRRIDWSFKLFCFRLAPTPIHRVLQLGSRGVRSNWILRMGRTTFQSSESKSHRLPERRYRRRR